MHSSPHDGLFGSRYIKSPFPAHATSGNTRHAEHKFRRQTTREIHTHALGMLARGASPGGLHVAAKPPATPKIICGSGGPACRTPPAASLGHAKTGKALHRQLATSALPTRHVLLSVTSFGPWCRRASGEASAAGRNPGSNGPLACNSMPPRVTAGLRTSDRSWATASALDVPKWIV